MSLKPTCKEVHRLTSEGLDRQLSLLERTRVRMHLLVCTACQNFTAQMQLIRRAMRQLGSLAENDNERDRT
ncbi:MULTISPECIES: zf-HC2 domain-containing protein [Oxalobacteraceae]|jgi:predicted anti-sigma-YlaC factor YlaD|uniref:zf-HC2 domain-containing protein n=1 Tax=Oxalobacteraceae TaxID=75682 RepID=UPI0010A59D3E|nr:MULTISPECIES: zf-HC2 domain-containing protein [Oxalobacteraceae]